MIKFFTNLWNLILGAFQIIKRPTLWISFIIAWIITNGHAYILLGVGMTLGIPWMEWYGATYLAILWMPFTPEKVITFPLAFFIEKQLFQISRNNKWLAGEIDEEWKQILKKIYLKRRKDTW